MKPAVKIQFSEKELQLMNDTSFLLTKRLITEKVCHLLHELKKELEQSPVHDSFPFPAGVDFHTGKISRGENFKGLPYLILDFPRFFEKEDIFAFRTMFWWGNYFSFTLQLKGKSFDQFRRPLFENLLKQKGSNWHIYIGENEWEHDLTDKSYVGISPKSIAASKKRDYLKLSRKIELNDFRNLNLEGLKTYHLFLSLLS